MNRNDGNGNNMATNNDQMRREHPLHQCTTCTVMGVGNLEINRFINSHSIQFTVVIYITLLLLSSVAALDLVFDLIA